MKDVFEKIQNDFNEFMKQAKELVEKECVANASKTKQWKPKGGDNVWFINDNGDLEDTTYLDGYDELSFKLGNRFKTKEEAQKELDRRLAEQELLEMCDWNGCDVCSCIYYDASDCEFYIKNFSEHFLNPYSFATEDSARKAVKQLGTEKLKLIFRID